MPDTREPPANASKATPPAAKAESREITAVDPDNRAVAAAEAPGSLLNFIAQAVERPDIDVQKLEALLRMQREVIAEDARVQFIHAMTAAQAEIAPVARDTENSQTKSTYAKLETVDAAIRPIYTKHGFSLSFDEEAGDAANMQIVCEVSHTAGHSKKYRLFAPPDTLGPKGSPTKTALHGRGSTITFLRRYLTCNIFNVVLRNQDDDGRLGGMKFISAEQAEDLRKYLKATGSDEGAFLQHFEAARIESLPEANYTPARNMLLSKLDRQSKAKRNP